MYTDHLEMVFIVLDGGTFFHGGYMFWLSLVNQKNEGDDFYGGKIIQLFFNKWFCKTEWI